MRDERTNEMETPKPKHKYDKGLLVVAKNALVLDSISEMIIFLDTAHNITWANRAAAESVNEEPKNLVGRKCFKVWPKREHPCEDCPVARALETNKPQEKEVETSEGEIWLMKGYPVEDEKGNVAGGIKVTFDITKSRKSEERSRNIFELIPDGIVIVDSKGTIESCNSAILDQTGFSRDEIVGKHFLKLSIIRAEDISRLEKLFEFLMRGEVPRPFEVRWVHKDGTTRWGEVHAATIEEESKIVGLLTIIRNITDRKKTEQMLRLSEEKYRTLVENLNVGVYRATPGKEGRFVDVNPAFARILGYENKEEVLELKVSDIYPDPMDRIKFNNKISTQGFVKNEELRLKRKDGVPIIVSDTAVALYDEDGTLMYFDGILEDITECKEYSEKLKRMVEERTRELRKTQEELIQREKLATLGQLAGSVGHEIRNPLGVISNSVYFIKMKLNDADEKVKKHLNIIEENVQRANKIAANLLDFARASHLLQKPTDINKVVEDALTASVIPETVFVTTRCDENVEKILVDPDQILQVFQNIISNAIQAMPDRGTLEIETEIKDDSICITFRDTGEGISEENLQKVFEPLFTTKTEGIGLGLPIARDIVERHKGTMRIQSKIGKGTIVTIMLPLKKMI